MHFARRLRPVLQLTVVAIVAALPVRPTVAGDLDRAIGVVLRMNEAAAQSQKRVAKMDDDTSDMAAEYRSVQEQLLSLNQYNDQLQKLVDAQEEQASELETQLEAATDIGRGVTPLMVRMVAALEAFVKLDVPFLLEERRSRLKQLKALLDRPDVTEAEKYRLITEAYQIENEFGRTIEAYRGELESTNGGSTKTVEFLRIGRIALVYRTIDSREIGAWNPTTRAWEQLDARYLNAIRKGFRVAQKQAAPDLFRVPVAAPEEPSR